MNGLKINYEETIQLGRKVGWKAEEFNTLLTKIEGINTELKEAWAGSDASKYSDEVLKQAQQMRKLATTVNEISVFLNKVGNAYKEVAESNAGAIQH